MSLRIAVWHNLPSGGGKRALYHQLLGLKSRGHQIEVWCPSTANRDFCSLSQIAPEHVVGLRRASQDRSSPGQKLLHLRDVFWGRSAMREHCRTCAGEINAGRFDLLYAAGCQFYAQSPIGRYVKLPKVLYLQEPFRLLYEAMPESDQRRHSFFGLREALSAKLLGYQAEEELFNARAYDKILVNSQFSRESVLRAYGLEAEVCYLGIDSDLFKPSAVPRERFILGVGSFCWAKGIDRAIRAVAMIPKAERPPLVWVGNSAKSDYLNQMGALAAGLQVSFQAEMLLGEDALVERMNRAALFLYAARLEPFGFTPLEANACGTAVVAIAEGGVRETIEPAVNGLLVDSADPGVLAQSILEVLRNPKLAQALGERGRERVVQKWNWPDSIAALERKLNSVSGA
jgi:glycosyltransferase involved in cell wall biosynthesis